MVNALLQEDLLDRIIISIIPVCVGAGTRLFKDGRPETHLKLVGCRSYEKGLVQVEYQRVKQ